MGESESKEGSSTVISWFCTHFQAKSTGIQHSILEDVGAIFVGESKVRNFQPTSKETKQWLKCDAKAGTHTTQRMDGNRVGEIG